MISWLTSSEDQAIYTSAIPLYPDLIEDIGFYNNILLIYGDSPMIYRRRLGSTSVAKDDKQPASSREQSPEGSEVYIETLKN